jgi:non-ribosomal peptide synthetase component E (peptide arylation enzyme)
VLDNVDGEEVPRGEEGLLFMSGPSIFQGYWRRPERNQEAFIERDGQRWYNTGDVVREDPDQGFLYAGRRDRMVKRRGYRIELGEIESVLYRHEQLREVAVVAVPDAEAGVKICAHLVAGDKKPGIIALKRFCADNLLSYMSPDLFKFHDALPRTGTNKVDYQSLKQP